MKKQAQVFEREFAGRKLTVEIGKLATQAHGSCTVRYGDTVVLATAVIAPEPREGVNYFPLMVDYEEKLYAAGKIKGSRFIKREGRATDEAVLTARLIDRSIRPLFKHAVRKDVQVIVTVLSIDNENDPDFPAMLATSIALGISPIPWGGPIAGVRLGQVDGQFITNPVREQTEKSNLDLFVSGTSNDVVMIEAGGQQVPEDTFINAIDHAQKEVADVLTFVSEIVTKCGVEKNKDPEPTEEERAELEEISKKVQEFIKSHDLQAVFDKDKAQMKANITELKLKLDELLKADNAVSKEARPKGVAMLEEALEDASRDMVLQKNIRVDGRGLDDIRDLSAEVGILPRTHGTGLFSRGETQVLSIVTLGSPGDEQVLDTMEESGKKHYMHHYNFPPYSVGEVKPMRGPSRRDIGHGALAEKAIEPLLPEREKFPYTIRVVSEVLGSNGSSSQASVCGSSLALMDAGVPIVAPCAGIAMGLMTNPNDKDDFRVLTDIQGIEDHSGDMDFKVAGTEEGITAIQLDIKLGGISMAVVKEAITKARVARIKILELMAGAISGPREELSQYAPRILSLRIPEDKIREVIGSGGKVINEIIETTGVESIDIDDDGLVSITSFDAEGGEKALAWVQSIVKEFEVGEVLEGPVTQIVTDRNSGAEIGAIVELGKGKDGMVHISQFSYDRIDKVSDVVKVGDVIKVKVVEVDKERGRIGLSVKALKEAPEGYSENNHRGPRRDNGFGRRPHHGGPRGRGPRPRR